MVTSKLEGSCARKSSRNRRTEKSSIDSVCAAVPAVTSSCPADTAQNWNRDSISTFPFSPSTKVIQAPADPARSARHVAITR